MSVGDDFPERADDVRFRLKIHGQIRSVPISKHAQPLEIRPLLIDLPACVLSVSNPEPGGVDLASWLTHLFLHLQFDRQTMTIPTRHIGCIVAIERAAFYDDVLDHLIDRVADVNIAIGVRRTIVKNEFRLPAARLADFLVQAGTLPVFLNFRLALGKISFHGKSGLRKVEGTLVIGHGWSLCRFNTSN